MLDRIQSVEIILPNGLRSSAELFLKWGNEIVMRPLEITVEILDRRYVGRSHRGPFFALQDLRRQLEPLNIRLSCFGAKLNVYPTPEWEGALFAVRRDPERESDGQDALGILENDGAEMLSSVDEQEAFHLAWLESKRQTRNGSVSAKEEGEAVMTDEQWRTFFTAAFDILGEGDFFPARSKTRCGWTTFTRLSSNAGYWSSGLPNPNDIKQNCIGDGGVWGQPFFYSDIAHIIVPKEFDWELVEDKKFYSGTKTQDIEALSKELHRLEVPHRITPRLLEIKLY